MDTNAIESLAVDIERADTVVALTGAGVSTASGVPSYRGENGLWQRFDKRDFHYRRFQSDPAGFWADRAELREALLGSGTIEPNAAHRALADLERTGYLEAIITQNVDGLHDRAGSNTVVRFHGTNREVECVRCEDRKPAGPVFEAVRSGESVPHCDECDGILKPAVVLFGESLPADAKTRAQELAADSDVFLAIGSSLRVHPAADLPKRAQKTGATVAILNLEKTLFSTSADYVIRADVTDVLPELVRTLRESED
jgi:NAD-dependent deacetylase